MGMTIIKIALVLMILCGGVALIWICKKIFDMAQRDIEDCTEEWKKLKVESSKLKG